MSMFSPLRRRAKLEPLSVDSERDLQDGDPFSTLFISPCQIKVSNDPFDEVPFEDIIPCNLKEYECPRNDISSTSRTELVISYDFEIHYASGVDLDATLDALEGAQLQHAASLAGLLDCGATAISRGGGARALQASSSLLTDDEKNALIAISSDPADVKDPQYTECIVPVQSTVTAGTTCVPVKGSITATVDSSASGPVQDGILRGMMRVARVGMTEDVYVSGNIRKVSFIGSRADTGGGGFEADSARAAEPQPDDGGGQLSGVGIAFIVIGSVLFVSLIAMFTVRRKRRKDMERSMEFHDATVEAKELESSQIAIASQDNSIRQAGAMEGADIPGSLAHADELALQPNTAAVAAKTGTLNDATAAAVYVPATVPEEAVSIGSSVDFLSDTGTQSFDVSSVDTGTENESIGTDMSFDTDTTSYEGPSALLVARLNGIAQSDDDDSDSAFTEPEMKDIV
eukprot:CAMPEP_0119008856 /NCGR_PEP_ID=MMETSP1176-20130426/3987_1 /TAXON_ID=265551 /ORGANISM="Synedropsis recta cf, Strain CCMP1620" /LENGTH=457 /DNA_ID=CAMNT_0006961265 /DNA_START=131 /DNA_END=1504 /DNA_ORIENTATION=-